MTTYDRPAALLNRPFKTFGEDAVYIAVDYSRNRWDESTTTKAESDIRVSTDTDFEARVLEDLGLRKDMARQFFSVSPLRNDDLVRWDSREWLIHKASRLPISPALTESDDVFYHAITERQD